MHTLTEKGEGNFLHESNRFLIGLSINELGIHQGLLQLFHFQLKLD